MKQRIPLSFKVPEAADREVRTIVASMFPDFNFSDYQTIFDEIVRLYYGNIAGFAGCDTKYHNLAHTLETLIATARLLHGIHVDHHPISERLAYLTLIAALYHDSGYIRRLGETRGTGAQFTTKHVGRSVDMLKAAGACRNWPVRDIDAMAAMIRCTDPTTRPETIEFPDREAQLGGHIVATADIISQMADEVYLERLPLLYDEFKEAGVDAYENEYDLFSRTLDFCKHMMNKMHGSLSGVIKYMSVHFRERYGIERDFYQESVDRNMNYLDLILKVYGDQYRKGLRRCYDRQPMPVLVAA